MSFTDVARDGWARQQPAVRLGQGLAHVVQLGPHDPLELAQRGLDTFTFSPTIARHTRSWIESSGFSTDKARSEETAARLETSVGRGGSIAVYPEGQMNRADFRANGRLTCGAELVGQLPARLLEVGLVVEVQQEVRRAASRSAGAARSCASCDVATTSIWPALIAGSCVDSATIRRGSTTASGS